MRRWLADDAIKPWQHRSWIFPRDPPFAVKGGRVLDLYQREWEGRPLGAGEYALSADEKPGVQARMRIHLPLPAGPGRATRVYFSVIQRKLLTPDDFEGQDELAAHILAFEKHYNAAARPFDWRFTRTDLNQLLARVRHHDRHAPHPMAA